VDLPTSILCRQNVNIEEFFEDCYALVSIPDVVARLWVKGVEPLANGEEHDVNNATTSDCNDCVLNL
jgi:hypothetical protein